MDARELRASARLAPKGAVLRRKGAVLRRRVESIIFLLVLLSFAARCAVQAVCPLRSFGRLKRQFA